MRFILIIFTITLTQVLACIQGYFEQAGNCLPCHSSCKEWVTGDTCTHCEKYMFYNETSGLCHHCPDGEYFSFSVGIWLSWDGSWLGYWGYQKSCLQCPIDESVDLDLLDSAFQESKNMIFFEAYRCSFLNNLSDIYKMGIVIKIFHLG